MRILALAAAAATLSAPSASSAADDFIKGVYLQTEELCTQARKETLQTVIEAGNVILTANGLEGIEYSCEFLQITKARLAPAWLVHAVCQEPGYLFPDVLSVTQLNATQLELVSVKPADPESGGGNGGSYFLCENVGAP
jgi:hypothetical protein